MASPAITIRKIEENVKSQLRIQAAENGRSMEEEAREILKNGVNKSNTPQINLAAAIRRRFAGIGGVELQLPEREAIRQVPNLRK